MPPRFLRAAPVLLRLLESEQDLSAQPCWSPLAAQGEATALFSLCPVHANSKITFSHAVSFLYPLSGSSCRDLFLTSIKTHFQVFSCFPQLTDAFKYWLNYKKYMP